MRQTKRPISRGVRAGRKPQVGIRITHSALPLKKKGLQGDTATLVGNSIYCFGGKYSEYFGAVLSLGASTWKILDVPVTIRTRAFHTAVLVDDKIYINGGEQEGQQYDTTMVEFDTVTEAYSHVETSAAGHRERTGASAVYTEWNRSIVYFGGMEYGNAQPRRNDITIFSFYTLSWRPAIPKGQLPPPRSGHGATLDMFNMYVFGGFGGGKTFFNDLWIADLQYMPVVTWSLVECGGFTPAGRITPSLNKIGSFLLVLGGSSPAQVKDENAVLLYLERKEWAKVPSESVKLSGIGPLARSYNAVKVTDGLQYLEAGGVYKLAVTF